MTQPLDIDKAREILDADDPVLGRVQAMMLAKEALKELQAARKFGNDMEQLMLNRVTELNGTIQKQAARIAELEAALSACDNSWAMAAHENEWRWVDMSTKDKRIAELEAEKRAACKHEYYSTPQGTWACGFCGEPKESNDE